MFEEVSVPGSVADEKDVVDAGQEILVYVGTYRVANQIYIFVVIHYFDGQGTRFLCGIVRHFQVSASGENTGYVNLASGRNSAPADFCSGACDVSISNFQ